MPKKRTKSQTLKRWVKYHQGKHFCQCGCGGIIPIKKSHHRPTIGIPKFLKGHNLQVKPEKEIAEEPAPAKESTWSKLTEEEKKRRLSHLKSFKRGKENPSWKGGRRLGEAGYYQIRCPDHPMAKDGYMYEHRLVVEERTRRNDPNNESLVEIDGELYLNSTCVVHHIDEVKTNNDSDNLLLLVNASAHAFIHRSSLPMEERLRRISLGIHHSRPLDEE